MFDVWEGNKHLKKSVVEVKKQQMKSKTKELKKLVKARKLKKAVYKRSKNFDSSKFVE
jgi:hypothetical protein